MKMIKGIVLSAIALSLVACSSSDTATKASKENPVKILAPMGATALSMLGLYGHEEVLIDTVDGSDVVTAELSKTDGKYDAIIAPINMGATLASKGKTSYLLDQVVTWGNLYIVGTGEEALKSEGIFAAFGEKTVPQKVLTSSMDVASITPKIQYFNSVNEVQQQLLAKKANVGLMAEPAATATIGKAKEKGIDLKVLKDLQKEYQAKNKSATKGYPQAALFVKKGSEDKVASYIAEATTFANVTSSDEKALVKAVETATTEKLGVPNSGIVQKTWVRQNIKLVKANTVKEDITEFLKQFKITLNDESYTK